MLTRKKVRRTKMIPPDGGWGWVVLSSALIVNFLIPGTVKSFGVLFVEFLHVFKASSTAASWMPALCYFLYSSLGPLSSILSTKYSYRTVTLIGGTFAASGMMLSYFANSVTYLYISYGLMVGIGAGLSFPPTVYIVTQYFEKLRGMATGLCISGSAIGTIVLPPLLQHLLDRFGYRGAVLIMGAITLNTLVCGLLYHPVEQHMKIVPLDDGIDNGALTLDDNTNFMILLPSYAIAEGFDKNSSALLLSIVSALDLIGRIGGASLSDIDFVPKYYYFVCGLGTSGIALALLPMATSYTMLSFFCGLFGLSSGMYIGITTVILADMLGTEKLSSSYGISLFVNGVLQLVGPPICGVIFENILSYKPIFLAFGIILILGTALWAVVPLIKRNNKKDIEAI
ncbi:Monocarboxylate transporter 12 [Trachymyrmex cornetzi]|uniref:Monocarboxylate transporter 12 n=1 Tax=Trachymyrmex cornetzi TaxID=471704 RepID=A0A195EL04_9HYME|nr:Monocarboxylate transporter 12 [Trachymyrmex cornetzi]